LSFARGHGPFGSIFQKLVPPTFIIFVDCISSNDYGNCLKSAYFKNNFTSNDLDKKSGCQLNIRNREANMVQSR
jgi:hypothetical protein